MTQSLNTRKMQMVAIVALTLTTTPLIMIDEKPFFNQGSLVIKVSANGQPIENVDILMTDPEKKESKWITNDDGYAIALKKDKRSGSPEIELASGSYQLDIRKAEYNERHIDVFVPAKGFVEKIVRLQASNSPPLANPGPNVFVQPNEMVRLDASESSDPDKPDQDFFLESDFTDEFGNPNGKRVESYHWRIVSKPVNSRAEIEDSNEKIASIKPDWEGKYLISLTVSDGHASATANMEITCDFPYVKKQPIPAPLSGHASAVVFDQAYIIGGWNDVFKDTNYAYNFKRNSWQIKRPLKIKRNHHLSFTHRNKIYIIGGHNISQRNGVEIVEVYDPEFDSWSTVSPMPTPRYDMSGNMINGKIYTFGGTGDGKAIEVYDPVTDRWERKNDMLTARYRHTSAVVNGKVYLIGGKGTESLVEVYDPISETWEQRANMPTPRYYLRSVSLNDLIYVIGGHGQSKTEGQKEVEEYDPVTNKWRTMSPLPAPLDIHSMNVYDSKIYIFGGESVFGASATMDVNQVYNPLFEKAVKTILGE